MVKEKNNSKMTKEELSDLKAKFERYEKAKKEFAETHNSLSCFYCNAEIKPGDDFIYDGSFSEEVYCSWECFGMSKQACAYTFNEGDEDYESMFPEKLED